MKYALNALKWIIENYTFFERERNSSKICGQQDFYFGVSKIRKYCIALFCVLDGVEPKNDRF